ncbi:aryl-sulfate sulfotransferase [Nocardioides carbamazepini]|uniref:aryl-sulfate sulfotransferase n=1 Tax=Nocardioides carbamazepini TaxID=2854259 RepID=UPI002149B11F|nr:aryl-sulfate sulfotransferase [Nocardioides carbamazepini]MCR1781549.1 aryl-sulfate sulfotransferase [Nocardioides carbamazepini]
MGVVLRLLLPVLVPALLLGTVLAPAPPAGAAGSPEPVVALTVSGAGVALSPVFDPAVSRYAVATTAQTGGRVAVTATTSDPAGVVRVDGAVVSGPTEVTGLAAGDEVSVTVDDAAGHHAYALVYLPSGFPEITTAVDGPETTEGHVLVTLGTFAAALDRNGVPVYVHDFGQPVADLKPAPHGHYTLMRRLPGPASDWDLVELDAQLREVAVSRTVGLVNTDNHDSILRPDGSRLLLAYEPDAGTGFVDAVVQEVDAAGEVVYTWDSGDHLDRAETTAGAASDWAHINSIEILPGGDVLASFRHLSAALRIAWSDHDGYQRGDVVWRFGGRRNDFTFVNDLLGGPCAQHTVSRLPDGHLLVFDNGSVALGATPSYCLDPGDRLGPTVDRAVTRVTEYELDETTLTATLVHTWDEPGRFAYFAGSARRLAGGNTLVNWAAFQGALVSEVAPDGRVVWELAAPSTLSYRAEKAVVPDRIDPVVELALPGGGVYEVGETVAPRVRCTDRGGSTLQSCTLSATALATGAPGEQSVTLTAVDGAGNTATVQRSYAVVSAAPAVTVRSRGAWRAHRTLRLPQRGDVRRAVLRLANTSAWPAVLTLRGSRAGSAYRVRYVVAGRDVTAAVLAGTWRTPLLAPGQDARVKVVVTRRGARAVPRRSVRVVAARSDAPASASSLALGLRSR